MNAIAFVLLYKINRFNNKKKSKYPIYREFPKNIFLSTELANYFPKNFLIVFNTYVQFGLIANYHSFEYWHKNNNYLSSKRNFPSTGE